MVINAVFDWQSQNKNQTNYLPIRQLKQSQTVVKPKTKPEPKYTYLPDYFQHSVENLSEYD